MNSILITILKTILEFNPDFNIELFLNLISITILKTIPKFNLNSTFKTIPEFNLDFNISKTILEFNLDFNHSCFNIEKYS